MPEDAAASHNLLEELWQTSAGMDPQDTEDNRKVLGMGIVGLSIGRITLGPGTKPSPRASRQVAYVIPQHETLEQRELPYHVSPTPIAHPAAIRDLFVLLFDPSERNQPRSRRKLPVNLPEISAAPP